MYAWSGQENRYPAIDKSNPLSKGLLYAFPLSGSGQDAVNGGGTVALQANGSWQAGGGGMHGLCLRGTPVITGGNASTVAALDLRSCNSLTIAFTLSWDSFVAVADALVMEQSVTANSSPGFWMDWNEGGGTCVYRFNPGVANDWKFARPTAGVPHRYVITANMSVPSSQVYIDGNAVTTTTFALSNASVLGLANDNIYLMSRANAALQAGGYMQDLFFWNRQLTDIEAKMDFRNTSAIYLPPAISEDPWAVSFGAVAAPKFRNTAKGSARRTGSRQQGS